MGSEGHGRGAKVSLFATTPLIAKNAMNGARFFTQLRSGFSFALCIDVYTSRLRETRMVHLRFNAGKHFLLALTVLTLPLFSMPYAAFCSLTSFVTWWRRNGSHRCARSCGTSWPSFLTVTTVPTQLMQIASHRPLSEQCQYKRACVFVLF
jgi:hypothetical protein